LSPLRSLPLLVKEVQGCNRGNSSRDTAHILGQVMLVHDLLMCDLPATDRRQARGQKTHAGDSKTVQPCKSGLYGGAAMSGCRSCTYLAAFVTYRVNHHLVPINLQHSTAWYSTLHTSTPAPHFGSHQLSSHQQLAHALDHSVWHCLTHHVYPVMHLPWSCQGEPQVCAYT
jgi:hypothetical protein